MSFVVFESYEGYVREITGPYDTLNEALDAAETKARSRPMIKFTIAKDISSVHGTVDLVYSDIND